MDRGPAIKTDADAFSARKRTLPILGQDVDVWDYRYNMADKTKNPPVSLQGNVGSYGRSMSAQDETEKELEHSVDSPGKKIRVLRLIEYIYDTAEAAEKDMNKWQLNTPPTVKYMRMRSVSMPFEVFDWSESK